MWVGKEIWRMHLAYWSWWNGGGRWMLRVSGFAVRRCWCVSCMWRIRDGVHVWWIHVWSARVPQTVTKVNTGCNSWLYSREEECLLVTLWLRDQCGVAWLNAPHTTPASATRHRQLLDLRHVYGEHGVPKSQFGRSSYFKDKS